MLDHLVIGTLTVLTVVVVAVGLFFLRNVSSGDFSGHDQPGRIEWYDDWPKRYAWLSYPAVNAEGAERVQDWQGSPTRPARPRASTSRPAAQRPEYGRHGRPRGPQDESHAWGRCLGLRPVGSRASGLRSLLGGVQGLTMIALLGRWYDRLAQRVGQTTAGAVVLAVGAVVWFVIAWALGGAW